MNKIFGIVSILMALASWAIGFVPGATSLIAIVITLVAIWIAVLTCEKHQGWYYSAIAISLCGILFINDLTRIWFDPINAPIKFKLTIYLAIGITMLLSLFASKWLKRK